MFYLFNRIHLKPSGSINRSKDQIVLSGQAYLPELSDEDMQFLEFAIGRRVFVADSYQALLDTSFEGKDINFLKYLFDYKDRSLEIHMSDEDLFVFLVKWYKSILPNLPLEEGQTLFNLLYKAARYQFKVELNGFTSEHFSEVWAKTDRFDFDQETLNGLGENVALEYRLASYFDGHQNESFKAALQSRLKTMVHKTHLQALCDARKSILQRLESLTPIVSPIDIRSFIDANPSKKFLFDPRVAPNQLDYVLQTYKIDDLRDAYQTEMTLAQGPSSSRFVETSHFLDPHITLDEIVEFELTSLFNRVFLGQGEYRNSVNHYVLNDVLNAFVKKDKNKLNFYSLQSAQS